MEAPCICVLVATGGLLCRARPGVRFLAAGSVGVSVTDTPRKFCVAASRASLTVKTALPAASCDERFFGVRSASERVGVRMLNALTRESIDAS